MRLKYNFVRASFLHLIKDTDSMMEGYAVPIFFFKVDLRLWVSL